MNNDYFEADFKGFGYRELVDASKLLKEIGDNGISDKLNLSMPIKVALNANSGNVFLVDEDFNVVMENEDGELENFLNCPECGNEGFSSEFITNTDEKLDGLNICPKCKYNF